MTANLRGATGVDPGGEHRVRAAIVAVTAFLVLAILLSLAVSVLQRRQEFESAAERTAQNLAQVIEEQTKGSIVQSRPRSRRLRLPCGCCRRKARGANP